MFEPLGLLRVRRHRAVVLGRSLSGRSREGMQLLGLFEQRLVLAEEGGEGVLGLELERLGLVLELLGLVVLHLGLGRSLGSRLAGSRELPVGGVPLLAHLLVGLGDGLGVGSVQGGGLFLQASGLLLDQGDVSHVAASSTPPGRSRR